MLRVLLYAVIAFAFAALAVVQVGSEALYAQPGSVSAALPHALGVRIYEGIEGVAHFPFVEEGLAEDALARNDLDTAQARSELLPDGARREDLLGRIAQARGNDAEAAEHFINAADADHFQPIADKLFKREQGPAFYLELHFCDRLRELKTHPDALGECYYQVGSMQDRMGSHREALNFYDRAVTLAPLNGRYMVTAGNEAIKIGDYPWAKAIFQRGVDANPANGDALAGLGIVALHDGDRALAQRFEARARAAQPKSKNLAKLDRLLQ